MIKPVAQGVTFEGALRFRNLMPDELGMLLLAITEPDVSDTPLPAHKLGGGRALGLGSVRAPPQGAIGHSVMAMFLYALRREVVRNTSKSARSACSTFVSIRPSA